MSSHITFFNSFCSQGQGGSGIYFMHNIWQDAGIRTRVCATSTASLKYNSNLTLAGGGAGEGDPALPHGRGGGGGPHPALRAVHLRGEAGEPHQQRDGDRERDQPGRPVGHTRLYTTTPHISHSGGHILHRSVAPFITHYLLNNVSDIITS